MRAHIQSFYIYLAYSLVIAQIINEVHPPPEYIKTIQLQELASERQIPLIELGKTLQFSFDDINGDEADYYYKIIHCDTLIGQSSQLMKSEYLRGMDDQHIQDYENSYNTLQILLSLQSLKYLIMIFALLKQEIIF